MAINRIGAGSGAGGSQKSGDAGSEQMPYGDFLKQAVFGGDGWLSLANRQAEEKPVKVRPAEGFNTLDYDA